ncbi:DUF3800 domain-containing protein [Aquabacterium sp. A7-Y]|uniref:DUF3800 domain-containing protein n=1 Tax=Aquabacterium sp. A7-Y TaxID=1349605 RepID=UPI00223D500B|nr:DUF3800 domain-containing protein [Aquabacterium sp. A7-Y]MCW7537980.1 DUF3800 domain-containing protein [Aquabacterium sp. A7-Y]
MPDQEPNPQMPVEEADAASPADPKLVAKLARIEREKAALINSVAAQDFSTLIARVASVLNLYPAARNSDVTLAIRYWESFQADVYKTEGILPADLFRLERFHLIVRARAKIQNEYRLFIADEKIRRHRRKNEDDLKEEILSETVPRNIVHVFADETGKNHRFVIVAAVWALTGRSVFKVAEPISRWKKSSAWDKREIHFARLGKQDGDLLAQFLDLVVAHREFLSFKVIAVERARTRRSIEEVLRKLHETMLIRGANHEVQTGRMQLPRFVEVTLDEEQSLDQFTLGEMKETVGQAYERMHGESLKIAQIQTVSSKHSLFVQLADLIAGAVNRRLNHDGDRGLKDDMADLVIQRLGLTLGEENLQDLDASVLFHV